MTRLPSSLLCALLTLGACTTPDDSMDTTADTDASEQDWRPPTEGRWVPAEWHPQAAVWLQWPRSFERSYEPAFAQIVSTILQYEDVHLLVHSETTRQSAEEALLTLGGFTAEGLASGQSDEGYTLTWHDIRNDSAWMRDNGPRYVVEDGELRIQNWEFNAWGGAFGDFPYINDNAVPASVGAVLGLPVDEVPIVHERGDLEFNGRDTVVLNWSVISDPARNPGITKQQVTTAMKNRFGVTQVVLLEGSPSGDLTGGHVDGLARFLDERRVVVPDCSASSFCQPGDADDQIYDASASTLTDAGFEVLRWPYPAKVSEGGFTFDTNYMNWLVGNGFVIAVGFGHEEADAEAKAQLEAWFHGREVHVIEMLDSWLNGGGVHCHTNDQPLWPWPDETVPNER